MPVVARVERKVAAALQRAGLAGAGATVVAGVSGGADSSALLYSLDRLRKSLDFSLHVAHLNHDFRGEEADEDARFVGSLAQQLGLPFSVAKQDPIAYQREHRISSFEQGAREMRYRFLADVAQRLEASAVAVGHTADDLAETVLLHIIRGAGLHGLAGMSKIAPWPCPTGLDTPVIFRPLLEVSKEETVEYCNELGQPYREDSGNLLFRFTRNRVRRQLMPLLSSEFNPQVKWALTRLAATARLDLDFIESEVERIWGGLLAPEEGAAVGPGSRPAVTLLRQPFKQLHPAMQRRALRRAYVAVKGDARLLAENHLQAMYELASSPRTGGTLDLPSGISMQLSVSAISLAVKDIAFDCPFPQLAGPHLLPRANSGNFSGIHFVGEWRVVLEDMIASQVPDLRQPDNFTAYLNPKALVSTLEVRKREEGDRFQPLGMSETKRLQDFFIDAKIPREWRERIPLLASERGIAWVVGYRIAEWAKVPEARTPDTPIVRVRFTQGTE